MSASTRVLWDKVPAPVKAALGARADVKLGGTAIVDSEGSRWYFARTPWGWNNLAVDHAAAAEATASDLTDAQKAEALRQVATAPETAIRDQVAKTLREVEERSVYDQLRNTLRDLGATPDIAKGKTPAAIVFWPSPGRRRACAQDFHGPNLLIAGEDLKIGDDLWIDEKTGKLYASPGPDVDRSIRPGLVKVRAGEP